MKPIITTLALAIILLSSTPAASAQSELRVFGDSLSDTGNVSALTFGLFPGAPYFNGRFSDGPIWVEGIATGLGLPLTANGSNPNALNGNNHAFGGSRAAGDTFFFPFFTIPGLESQVMGYLSNVAAIDSNALFVIASGANDVRDAADGLPPAQQATAISDAIAGIDNSIRMLAASGARQFLVANSPDIGRTPESIVVLGNSAVATQLSVSFNNQLATLLDTLRNQLGVKIRTLDFFGLINDIFDDANNNGGAEFGITNVTVPIFAGFAGSPGANPATSLFADDIHPSAVGHTITANLALDVITTSPQPGSGEDVVIGATRNGVPIPNGFATSLAAGEAFGFSFTTPAATYDGDAGLLLAQGFAAGSPPVPLGIEALWVDTNGILLDTILLAPTPTSIGGPTPPGLTGFNLRLQMIVLDLAAANGLFAATDALDMTFL